MRVWQLTTLRITWRETDHNSHWKDDPETNGKTKGSWKNRDTDKDDWQTPVVIGIGHRWDGNWTLGGETQGRKHEETEKTHYDQLKKLRHFFPKSEAFCCKVLNRAMSSDCLLSLYALSDFCSEKKTKLKACTLLFQWGQLAVTTGNGSTSGQATLDALWLRMWRPQACRDESQAKAGSMRSISISLCNGLQDHCKGSLELISWMEDVSGCLHLGFSPPLIMFKDKALCGLLSVL